MKNVLFIVSVSLSISTYLFSQTTSSIANGSWNSPLTWSCTCVPMPGSTVYINHVVTLPNSYAFTSGSITVNQDGVLQQTSNNDLWMNGGSLTNHGEIKMRYLWVQSGNFINDGIIHVNSFLNNVNFTNDGTFEQIDSLFTTGDIVNNGYFVEIDSMTNAGILTNNGTISGNLFTNTNKIINNNVISLASITNISNIENYDSITTIYSAWNIGKWTNNTDAFIKFNKSLLNDNTSNTNAHFKNNGKLIIGDSFYNMDSISGSSTGYISVQDSSYNSGIMSGNFNFCDFSPPANASQIVDINFNGTISSSITFCSQSGIDELNNNYQLLVYPNPFEKTIYFNLELPNQYLISDQYGKIIQSGINTNQIDLEHLTNGIYFLNLKNSNYYKTILISK